MPKFTFTYSIWVLALLVTACSRNHQKSNHAVVINDTSFLSDKNYPYKNVSDLATIRKKAGYFTGKMVRLYKDSTLKDTLVCLTQEQKTALLVPYVENKLGNGPGFLKNMMCYFISKQKKEMGLQPILIYMFYKDGTEYFALTILNNQYKVTNGYLIWGSHTPTLKGIKDSLNRYKTEYR